MDELNDFEFTLQKRIEETVALQKKVLGIVNLVSTFFMAKQSNIDTPELRNTIKEQCIFLIDEILNPVE